MLRQGDVLIIPVKKAKKGTETEDERFLKIMAGGGVDLKHEEHGAIHLAPGNYKVVRQREYSMEDVRFVRD